MQFRIPYGDSFVEFEAPSGQFEVIGSPEARHALSDAEIGKRFESPIASPPIEEIVSLGQTVLIVVPDATRMTACDSIVNLLVRRLIANGTMPYEIAIVFATGIHRYVTPDEKRRLITPFINQRIKTLDHHASDLMKLAGLGAGRFLELGEINGEPIEVNPILKEYDHIVIVGGVTFHYFAGFTGGRKLICPGLASARTIAATHRLAFDFENKSRRSGVGPGLLDGNAVHEAFVEVGSKAAPSFAVSTIVDERGAAVDVFCGDWMESHRTACDAFGALHTISLPEKRDFVIVGCGGSPYDLNMIQAHKALDAATRACNEGGTIILLAECAEGLGRGDFLKWFRTGNSAECAEMLCEKYEVNGQTAWSLLEKAERFDIRIVTSLREEETRAMRLTKIESVNRVAGVGYILPFGARFRCSSEN